MTTATTIRIDSAHPEPVGTTATDEPHDQAPRAPPSGPACYDVPKLCGLTPLHLASAQGHAPVVDALLSHGVAVDAQTAAGVTPLMLACDAGQADTADVLLRAGADVALKDLSGRDAFDVAVEGGWTVCAAWLTGAGADPNRIVDGETTLLIGACKARRVLSVATLLAVGADPHLVPADGCAAIHVATLTGDADVLGALLKHMRGRVDATYQDKTALMHACIWRRAAACVEALLTASAAVDAKNARTARTALMYAARYCDDGGAVVSLLLKAGADAQAKCANGWTALMYASHAGALHNVRALLDQPTDDNDGGAPPTAEGASAKKRRVVTAVCLTMSGIDVTGDARAATPAEAAAEAPGEAPFEAPVHVPDQASVRVPAEAPVRVPAEVLVAAPPPVDAAVVEAPPAEPVPRQPPDSPPPDAAAADDDAAPGHDGGACRLVEKRRFSPCELTWSAFARLFPSEASKATDNMVVPAAALGDDSLPVCAFPNTRVVRVYTHKRTRRFDVIAYDRFNGVDNVRHGRYSDCRVANYVANWVRLQFDTPLWKQSSAGRCHLEGLLATPAATALLASASSDDDRAPSAEASRPASAPSLCEAADVADDTQAARSDPSCVLQCNDGGCTAAALVHAGVWSSAEAADAALRDKLDAVAYGGSAERWDLAVVRAAVEAAGWCVTAVPLDEGGLRNRLARGGPYLVFGVTNNAWWCGDRKMLKYADEPEDGPVVAPDDWAYTVAVVDGRVRDFALDEDVRWLHIEDDTNRPRPDKGLMRTIECVWELHAAPVRPDDDPVASPRHLVLHARDAEAFVKAIFDDPTYSRVASPADFDNGGTRSDVPTMRHVLDMDLFDVLVKLGCNKYATVGALIHDLTRVIESGIMFFKGCWRVLHKKKILHFMHRELPHAATSSIVY